MAIIKITCFFCKLNIFYCRSCRTYRTYAELVAAGAIDLMVVATPSQQHAVDKIAALEAGMDVMVEKPMATTLADVDNMIAVAEENGVVVVERKPVARFLYANVDIGKAIPLELYQAVAEILNVTSTAVAASLTRDPVPTPKSSRRTTASPSASARSRPSRS